MELNTDDLNNQFGVQKYLKKRGLGFSKIVLEMIKVTLM